MTSFRRKPAANLLGLVLAFASLAWNSSTLAADPAQTLILIAHPALDDRLYGQSILVAHELRDGQHVGFILNKPTNMNLAEALPGHETAKAMTDPLYLGGPANVNVLFALVQGEPPQAEGTLVLSKNIYLAVSDAAVGKAMHSRADNNARFFVGSVLWHPGELDAEIKKGAWYVLDATPDRVLPKRTTGLWEEMVLQAEIVAKGI